MMASKDEEATRRIFDNRIRTHVFVIGEESRKLAMMHENNVNVEESKRGSQFKF